MIEYINCLSVAEELNAQTLSVLNGEHPLLCIACAGKKADDEVYIRGVKKDADRIGILVSEEQSTGADGVLLIGDKNYWNNSVSFNKRDVDGATNSSPYTPAVTEAIWRVIFSRILKTNLAGENVTVIGRGTVGHSVANMLLGANATVSIAHSKTSRDQLDKLLAASDIVVCAAGNGTKFGAGALADGAILIDVSNSFVFDDLNKTELRKLIVTPRRTALALLREQSF